jgi:hypothetical protein
MILSGYEKFFRLGHITPCSPVKVIRHFGRTIFIFCLFHVGFLLDSLFNRENEDYMPLRNVG